MADVSSKAKAMALSDIPDPAPAERKVIDADAPQLLPLLESCPGIRIYTRSHSEFKTLNTVIAAKTDDEPLAIVRVKSEDEIAATIRLCENSGLPLAVRSGGNDIGDRNYVQDGVIIDVRLLNSITVSFDRTTATVGGGVILGRLLHVLNEQGLDTPTGWGCEVGYAAWACGGGYGIEAGARGLGVDQILGGRIVTPSGVVVAGPDAGEDEDAYWCLRGGGPGIIGVVSQLTIKVYPRPSIFAGNLVFPLSEVEGLFGNLEQLFAAGLPESASAEAFILNPPGIGGIVNHFFWWQLKNDASDLPLAEEYLKRISQCGTVLKADVKQTTPYQFPLSMENPGMEKQRQFFSVKSCTVPGFTAEFGRVLSKHSLPTPTSALVIHNCHGLGAKPDAFGAFGNRRNHLLVGISATCSYTDEETRKKTSNWSSDVLDDLAQANLPLPGKYLNFNPPEPGDGMMYFGKQGLERVRAIKKRFDPMNVFFLSTPNLEE